MLFFINEGLLAHCWALKQNYQPWTKSTKLSPTSNPSNEQNWRLRVLNWRPASEKVKTPFDSKGGLFHIWWWMLNSQYLLLQLRYVWTRENMRAYKKSLFAELFSCSLFSGRVYLSSFHAFTLQDIEALKCVSLWYLHPDIPFNPNS